MARIDELFRYLKRKGGSDLHLAAGLAPRIRLHGELHPVEGAPVLDDAHLRKLLREVADERQWADFERRNDLDFAYGLEGVARFRANYFRQERGAGAVFRIIPERIIPLEELSLPPALEQLANLSQGLVLVTGPTGSGKSTTLASILDRINATSARHVVTIEDPVEFVHQNKRCTFTQREIGTDAESFATALRAAMRQDAGVILVGEMRDSETIGLAITAAEMGALVFGTLHTNGAVKTVDRILDAFPPEQQPQVRAMLAESLAGIVSQLLIRTADGEGRAAAIELMLRGPGLGNIIREGNAGLLGSFIQGGRGRGMQSMDDALFGLVQAGRIAAAEAYLKASDKKRFEPLVAASPA